MVAVVVVAGTHVSGLKIAVSVQDGGQPGLTKVPVSKSGLVVVVVVVVVEVVEEEIVVVVLAVVVAMV